VVRAHPTVPIQIKNLAEFASRADHHWEAAGKDESLRIRLRRAIELPICAAALLLVLLGVLFWPAWSEDARKRRLGIMAALAGDG
jgi:hypothetical protein